jgi:hypothetical protein
MAKLRMNCVFPEALSGEIQKLATRNKESLPDTFRRLLKYGLLVDNIITDPTSKLIIREGQNEREIVAV